MEFGDALDSCHHPHRHHRHACWSRIPEMRIRAAKIEELTPKARERALSPRQLAALQREEEIRKALARLKSDEDILALELDPAEKIPTMRAAVKRAIAAYRPGANMAIRGRTIYISTGVLPGGRGRKPKAG
jgi:ferric-dicitrate binding protein FerR (iron transport regulator)